MLQVRIQLHGGKDGMLTQDLTKPPGMTRTALHICRNRGVTALYQGLSASLLRQAMFIGTKFGAYDVLKAAVDDGSGKLSFVAKTSCGFGAGAIGAAVGNPADLAMVRMQADGRLPVHLRRNYANGFTAIRDVVREEGLFALWRGCTPTVQRAMLITASQLAVYDEFKEYLAAHTSLDENHPSSHILCSLFASSVASLTSNPVDVIKTRLMNMKALPDGTLPYKGSLDCAVQTARQEGVMALYKGLVPTMARQAPLNAVRFVVVEQMRKILAPL
eukprot:CAMPEP_0182853306 /NCGR_PEP_ID=MMETSP0034_2-20130328/633_1 /TAXON_ID=156128 /ORGANISM="Nephroselmis pyriformis, Strain CCMP717" /LENGTH=273 /DNA_ID=CAMNT_0024984069 /DNA_START=79 /DNA_END=900 /DNA_ORIENTATION=-